MTTEVIQRAEFAPSGPELESLRATFNLSYHLPYAAKAAQQVGFVGKRILEVGGSLPPVFVRDSLGAAQWTAVEELSYWRTVEAGGHRKYAPLGKSYTNHLSA